MFCTGSSGCFIGGRDPKITSGAGDRFTIRTSRGGGRMGGALDELNSCPSFTLRKKLDIPGKLPTLSFLDSANAGYGSTG